MIAVTVTVTVSVIVAVIVIVTITITVTNIITILLHIKISSMHQTHYEKSDWSRAFNQFTITCELDMIKAISAADIGFTISSSTSAWLLSHLERSQKQKWLNALL